jgi:hypothetical protein
MEKDQVRLDVVKEAKEELWGKMVDMQRGNRPLSEAEWRQVLGKLEEWVVMLGEMGEG